MLTTKTKVRLLMLVALSTPMLCPSGGCSGSGRTCGKIKVRFLGLDALDIEWDISWSDGLDDLPPGSIYVGTIQGLRTFLAPDGTLYVKDVNGGGYHQLNPPYPAEIQEAIAELTGGNEGENDGGDGNSNDACLTIHRTTRLARAGNIITEASLDSIPANPGYDPDGEVPATECVFTPPADCGIISPIAASEADPSEESTSVNALLDFEVDVEEDTALVQYTLALDAPDIDSKMAQLVDMFGVEATAFMDSELGTTTINIEGTTNGVLRSLYALGFEELKGESAWPGDLEIRFDRSWSAVFVFVDGELERFVPMRIGAD